MTLGIIGLGQGGSSIADLFSQNGYLSVAINYSLSDLDSLQHIQNKHHLLGSEGVGKDRSLATQLMQNNWEKTVNVVKEQFNHSSIKLIFVVFSTGGGSGSGIAPLICDLLSNELEDKIVVGVPILPHNSESTISHLNTLDCIQELSEVDVCLLPIDNNAANSTSKLTLYKEVNETFFNTIHQMIQQTSLNSPYSNLDQTDLLKLFSTVGWSTILSTNIANISSQINLTDSFVIDSLTKSSQHSIFMKSDYSKVIRVGFIYHGQKSIMNIVNPQQIISQFNNQPLDTFEGWYPSDSQANIRLIYTGLSFDKQRLNEIESKTIQESETLKNVLNESHRVNVKSQQINLNKPTKQKKVLSSILAKYQK